MKTSYPALLAAAVGALMMVACGSTRPTVLNDAHAAYDQAATGPAALHIPDRLVDAKAKLDAAQSHYADDGDTRMTRHLAYLALREAEIVHIEAQSVAHAKNKGEAIVTRGELANRATEELGRARSQLGESRSDTASEREKRLQAERAAQGSANEMEQQRKEIVQLRIEAEQARAKLEKLAKLVEDERGVVITLLAGVLFESDQAAVKHAASDRLMEVVSFLRAYPNRPIVVEGHTDSEGRTGYNETLSESRASSVRNFLVQHGIDPSRVTTQGFGEQRPVATNATVEGRATNRRVEIIVQPADASEYLLDDE